MVGVHFMTSQGMSQRTNQAVAIVAIFLLGVGGVLIATGILASFPTSGSTASTTDTTSGSTTTIPTTTTDPTTTIINDVEPKTLVILSTYDIVVQNIFETAFLGSAFAIQNNINDITWRVISPDLWDDWMDAELVDVCWGGGSSLFDELVMDGRLSPLVNSLMQEVESRVYDTIAGVSMKGKNSADQVCWIASKLSSYGFTVNHGFLDTYTLPMPRLWAALGEPRFGAFQPNNPSIAMVNALNSPSHLRIYQMIVQMLGWSEGWTRLTRMAGSSELYGSSGDAQNAVEIGDVAVSLSSDHLGFLSHNRNPECEYIIPYDGTLIEGDPIGMAATSSQKNLAEGFIDFVLSPYGQSLWLDSNLLRLPIMREAFDEPSAAGKTDVYAVFNQTIACSSFAFNETQALEIRQSFIHYFEAVLTDSHSDLVSCWSAMAHVYIIGFLTYSELTSYAYQMAEPVTIVDPNTSLSEKFTLEYAKRINDNITQDAIYRSIAKTRWTTSARIQYQNVEEIVVSLPACSYYPPKDTMIVQLQAMLVFLGCIAGFVTIPSLGSKFNQTVDISVTKITQNKLELSTSTTLEFRPS